MHELHAIFLLICLGKEHMGLFADRYALTEAQVKTRIMNSKKALRTNRKTKSKEMGIEL